ncbi:large ribosomal subunit protein uL24c [Magnolia sinica]|uniref:large ribosomal subunit protein uL24c n=1 Tax=Magnolia sinica TaxID=86752 RepID=UPI002659EB1B|nr:large ribosomal subunit protein uL24c [Magnolia sinica]
MAGFAKYGISLWLSRPLLSPRALHVLYLLVFRNVIFSFARLYLSKEQWERNTRQKPNTAAMAALQSSMAALSLSSSSFLGQRLSPSLYPAPVKFTDQPCLIVMKLKRWERKECKPNGLPVIHKMHVKVGDTVKIISGREKGKIGEITQVFKHNSTVIIKDMNLKTKHMKSRGEDQPGQIVKIEAPIHSSNVMLYSKEQEVASRVGHKFLEDGTKVRYLLKTGEIIDNKENWKKVPEEVKEAEAAAV